MKKLLSILASIGIIGSSVSSIMAMSPDAKINKPEIKNLNSNNLSLDKTDQFLKVIDVPKTANVSFKAFNSVLIKNFKDLKNVKVWSNNTSIVKAQMIDNYIQFYGESRGKTNVVVTADDAQDAIIAVTVDNLKVIDVDKNAETYVTRTTNLQIRNAAELTGIEAQSINPEIALVKVSRDQIRITGVKIGTTTVIVSADNVATAAITVTISKLENIEVDKDKASIVIGNMINVKITNYQNLKNAQVLSANPKTASVTKIGDLIFIKGTGIGTVDITIWADNALDKAITVSVHDLIPIEVDKDSVSVSRSGNEQVKITNFSNLDEVVVRSDNNSIATATFDEQGVITIFGVNVGTTILRITAKDAVEKQIAVTVEELKTIDVDKTVEVYYNDTISLQVKNAVELKGLKAVADNPNVSVQIDGNKIVIKGSAVGAATVTVSALNAYETTIEVTVKNLKTIAVESKTNVVVGRSTMLQINNFQDLTDIKVKSDDSQIASVGLMDDNSSILILGISKGTVNVTVSALNAWDETIEVTVNDLKKIEVDQDSITVDHTGYGQVKITNFSTLEQVNIKSDDNSIATANINNQGVITIFGVNVGTTTLRLTANDAAEKEITVVVNELTKIVVDKEHVALYGETIETVNITNFSNLKNVMVESSNERVATVAYNKQGVIKVIRADGSNVGNKTSIKITADHAEVKTISVSIEQATLLTNQITTLALDSEQEVQVINEVINRNPGLTKEDIRVKKDSFKAPDVKLLKLGEVIIESISPKYIGEIKLLLVPKMPSDSKTEELMTKIKNGKDLNERKPYWKEYFNYKGDLFFKNLMPQNPWSFKETDFEGENKQIKPEAFTLLSRYWDAVVQRLLQQDYRTYKVTTDYSSFDYNITNYDSKVEKGNVTIHFLGFYSFKMNDGLYLYIGFDGNIEGKIFISI